MKNVGKSGACRTIGALWALMLVMMAGPMLYSQGPGFSGYTASWLQKAEGWGNDWGEGISVDEVGNVYVGGTFSIELLFPSVNPPNPLMGVGMSDAWVGKLDSSGQWVWAQSFGDSDVDGIFDVAYDLRGYVYVVGAFADTVDFSGHVRQSMGSQDGFLMKLRADNGSVVWVRQFSSDGLDRIRGVAVAPDGDVYVTGFYQGDTLFWEGDAGNFLLSMPGQTVGFVARLDSSGSLEWINGYGGARAYLRSVTVDSSGNAYVGGYIYGGWVDFDAGTGPSDTLWVLAYLDDPVVFRLDGEGGLVWLTHLLGRTQDDRGEGVALDEVRDRVYLTGCFLSDTLAWAVYKLGGLGPDSYEPLLYHLTPSWMSIKEAFVVGCEASSGRPFWAYQMGNKSGGVAVGSGVAVDRDGDVYVTGWFSGDIYFDVWETNPSLQNGFVNSQSVANSLFIWKWDWDLPNADSGVVWYEVSGGEDAAGFDIAVDGCKHVYVTGWYDSVVRMLGGQVGLVSYAPGYDALVYKVDQYDCPDCILAAACHEYTSPLGNNVWTQSGFYMDINPIPSFCDDTLFVSLTIYPSPPVSLGAPWRDVVCPHYPYLVQPSPPGGQLTVPYPGVIIGYDSTLNPPGYKVVFKPVPGLVAISYSYTDDYGCTTVVTDTVEVDTSADCKPQPLIRSEGNGGADGPVFRYGPTVVREGLNVYWGGSETLMMSIYDVSGRLRRRILVQPGEQRIRLSNLPAGSYYIKVDSGRFYHPGRFVKVR